MAESADAAVSKTVPRKGVGVRLPLSAPDHSGSIGELCVSLNRLVLVSRVSSLTPFLTPTCPGASSGICWQQERCTPLVRSSAVRLPDRRACRAKAGRPPEQLMDHRGVKPWLTFRIILHDLSSMRSDGPASTIRALRDLRVVMWLQAHGLYALSAMPSPGGQCPTDHVLLGQECPQKTRSAA
jgi:hypothetical protein